MLHVTDPEKIHLSQNHPTPFPFLNRRPRRNRKSSAIRQLVQETRLHSSQLVAPLFVVEGKGEKQPILSMPHVYRYSLDRLLPYVEGLCKLGVSGVDLFTALPPEAKDSSGSESRREGNLLQRAIRILKHTFPALCVMADVALDPFTDHGHDGIVNSWGEVDNDGTLNALGHMALRAAEAGVDIIAPSDMMDGRVAYLRYVLDKEGHSQVSILAYAAKYASAFYGPFRDALGSTPKFGDKKSYQMDPANGREALLECALDEEEGADMLLIKPALPYLDVLSKVRASTSLPLAAYHVSGEYAMVMAAAQQGWVDADKVFMESLLSIKRAGADFILTYAAERVANLLRS